MWLFNRFIQPFKSFYISSNTSNRIEFPLWLLFSHHLWLHIHLHLLLVLLQHLLHPHHLLYTHHVLVHIHHLRRPSNLIIHHWHLHLHHLFEHITSIILHTLFHHSLHISHHIVIFLLSFVLSQTSLVISHVYFGSDEKIFYFLRGRRKGFVTVRFVSELDPSLVRRIFFIVFYGNV